MDEIIMDTLIHRAFDEENILEEPPRTAEELDTLLPNDNRASRYPRFKAPAERRFHRWEQTAGEALTKREVDWIKLVMGLRSDDTNSVGD